MSRMLKWMGMAGIICGAQCVQAVLIYVNSSIQPPTGNDYVGSVHLIYVASGDHTGISYDGDAWIGGSAVDDYTNESTLSGSTPWVDNTDIDPRVYVDGKTLRDTETRTGGQYYLGLLTHDGYYSVSMQGLDYNATAVFDDTGFIGSVEDLHRLWAATEAAFDWPGADGLFTEWTLVPEPSSVVLLAIGAAVAALRRQKRAAV